MGEKDVTEKKLLDDNRRFADLVNAAVCRGRQVIRAEELREADPVSAVAAGGRKRQGRATKERYRDILRKATRSMNFILIGIENQEHVHYAMPARTMLMDALTYEKELARRRKMHREKKDLKTGGEFLSGFARGERLKPVCTIVVYYGKELWDGAVSLRGMLDLTDIPPELRDLVNDYPIHLIDVRRFEGINLFQTDLRQIFGILQHMDSRKELYSYLEENKDFFSCVPEDACQFICSMTGPNVLKKIRKSQNAEKEGYNMYMLQELFDKTSAEGRAEGRAQGRAEGRVEGRAQGRAEGRAEGKEDGIRLTKEAERLYALGKSVSEIAAILHVTEEQARMMTD